MNNTENLMLEHLKRFQAGQDRIERKLEDLTRRVGNLETGQAAIIQHLGTLAAALMAGVMPVMWNHSTPSNALSQSISPGLASAMAE